jgi:hypothetical protein
LKDKKNLINLNFHLLSYSGIVFLQPLDGRRGKIAEGISRLNGKHFSLINSLNFQEDHHKKKV